jgi:hypothetical protein
LETLIFAPPNPDQPVAAKADATLQIFNQCGADAAALAVNDTDSFHCRYQPLEYKSHKETPLACLHGLFS